MDFIHKLAIAKKEANETLYWLELLHQTDYLSKSQFSSLQLECEGLLKLLASIIKTSKSKINREC